MHGNKTLRAQAAKCGCHGKRSDIEFPAQGINGRKAVPAAVISKADAQEKIFIYQIGKVLFILQLSVSF
ncbi:hypothetical protein HMPREF1548_05230 [Clostridium sp. KLE 1755]|nr:hypothetical protein HMPREF1548_05230 [Clostridium sp. KLE 1755]